jgi:hypothetical protein
VTEAKRIVDRLLEADKFDAREYLAKTPDEEFDEGTQFILRAARQLYGKLKRSNVLGVAAERRRGALHDMPADAIAQAVLQLALEQESGPGTRRAYLRIKRYGRFLY